MKKSMLFALVLVVLVIGCTEVQEAPDDEPVAAEGEPVKLWYYDKNGYE